MHKEEKEGQEKTCRFCMDSPSSAVQFSSVRGDANHVLVIDTLDLDAREEARKEEGDG